MPAFHELRKEASGGPPALKLCTVCTYKHKKKVKKSCTTCSECEWKNFSYSKLVSALMVERFSDHLVDAAQLLWTYVNLILTDTSLPERNGRHRGRNVRGAE